MELGEGDEPVPRVASARDTGHPASGAAQRGDVGQGKKRARKPAKIVKRGKGARSEAQPQVARSEPESSEDHKAGANAPRRSAAELSRQTGAPMDPMLLRRTRWTRSQVGMTRDQRRRNLAGALRVPRSRRASLEGRNVLLIDDVITTGATVEACARTLKRARAARVDVLALALVTSEALVAV